jgi:hypothetical protein
VHGRKAALIRAIAAVLLALQAPGAGAQKDAAERVREGDVNQWVEYYRQQRAATPPPKEATADKAREARDGPRK